MKKRHPLYDYQWQKLRKQYLQAHALCVECYKQNKVVAATVIDHIVPHKGNLELFYDEGNYQALCTNCHSSHKQRFEKTGRIKGCDKDGTPIDPNHPWNRHNG